ncbi:hypothetical protein Tco_0381918 [Tanacetum coccineum]
MKIQAGVQGSRQGELRRHIQLWKFFGRLYFIVIVLDRNIALRIAKIVQDKKSISKIKEKDTGKISDRIKKRGKSKARKKNIEYDGDDDQLCSLSQGDSENDESVSMYSLGASLGITLDGKPACSNNDMFGDFLSELSNNERPFPPL